MPNGRRLRYLAWAALLLALAPGCQGLFGSRPAPVLVRDAETNEPIPGAEVRLSYPPTQLPVGPPDCSEKTGDDGVARVQAAPYGDGGVAVGVTARGYLSEEKVLSAQAVRALEPAHLFEAAERRPPALVVELYAEPRPAVELIVPAGYRGLIRAAVRVQEDAPSPPGQRSFPCVVPASGVVEVVGPPLLRRVFVTDFRARFADGAPLSREGGEGAVGLWWVKDEGGFHHFLVGTRDEFNDCCRSRPTGGEGGGRPAAGKGGGRGRGSHRGGDPSSDAGQARGMP